MPVIIAALGIAAAVYFFVIRARNAANMATDLVDVANDVRLAARRFGFKRKTNVHPVETIEDPKLAIGAIATAFLEMDNLPTKDQRDTLHQSLQSTLGLDNDAASAITILGHWFVSECNGPRQAVPRLSRKLAKLQGHSGFQPLMEILGTTIKAGSEAKLNPAQHDALNDVKRAFRIK